MVDRLRNAWRALTGRAYYAAAKTPRTAGDWTPAETDLNTILRTDGQRIRARARALVRDVPHVARAVDALVEFVVGQGIELRPAVLTPAGTPAAAVNRRIEDAWQRWQEQADIGGRLHWCELQQLARRSEAETGEALTLLQVDPRQVQLQLQAIEPDRLVSYTRQRPGAGRDIDQGIEYDTNTGRALRYTFTSDLSTGATTTVDARQVVHAYRVLRPDQLRGVSPFAPAVLLAHALRDYLETELDGARMAAKWLAFVHSPDPIESIDSRGAQVDDDEPSPQRKIEEVGNAMIDYLLPGEQVTMASANRPTDAFSTFSAFCLRAFAVVSGVSYEVISGDYQGINYSTLRGIRNDLAKSMAVHQARFVRQQLTPIYRTWLDLEVLSGRLHLPGYWTHPERYQRTSWKGPGMSQVDPLKEGKADAEQVANLLKSPQEAISARGADPAEVLRETAEYYQQARELGLTPAWAPAAAPAAAASPDDDSPDANSDGGSDDETP